MHHLKTISQNEHFIDQDKTFTIQKLIGFDSGDLIKLQETIMFNLTLMKLDMHCSRYHVEVTDSSGEE